MGAPWRRTRRAAAPITSCRSGFRAPGDPGLPSARVASAQDARKGLALGAGRVINVKVARVGGHAEAGRVHDVAQAFGAHGERVSRTAEFGPALARALAVARDERRPALLHLQVDPDAITPNLTLAQIRRNAEQAGR